MTAVALTGDEALSIVPNGWPLVALVVVAVLAAVAMELTVGMISGSTLARFHRSSVNSSSTGTQSNRVGRAVVFAWTVLTVFVVESLIVGVSALPAVTFYQLHLEFDFGPTPLRLFMLAAAILPAYVVFAMTFMFLSAELSRLLGWRPPPRADLRIADLSPELRNWARYAILGHLVRVVAGPIFRSTPVWIWYMRRNGARIGRRVWVNSLQVVDDCLLDFGDDVVIGAGVHLSAHTAERGLVRLAPIKLGRGTTVGVGAHIGIGVVTGEQTQIGSMAVVPKHAQLDAHRSYGGIRARPLDHPVEPSEKP